MSKVDRSIPRSITSPQTAQTERTATPSATAAVQSTAAVQANPAITGQTEFAQLNAALAQLTPQQQHVGRSADPGALWGQQPAPDNIRARFAAASPEEKKIIRAQVMAEKAKCEGKISERTDKLEKRWKRMNGAKRQEILKQYTDKAGAKPEVKAKIEAAQKQATAMQAEIDAMCAKLKATYPAKTPAEDKERRALKKELIELRNHQREVLNGATDLLAADGKKLELLATNEKNIDPKGTITKGEESLLSLIGKWLGFNQTLTFFDHFLEQNRINLEDQRKKIEQEQLDKQIQEGDQRKKLQFKSDMEQRELLKQLAQKIEGVRKG